MNLIIESRKIKKVCKFLSNWLKVVKNINTNFQNVPKNNIGKLSLLQENNVTSADKCEEASDRSISMT